MDKLEDIIYIIKRYLFPTLFLVVGLVTLSAALTPQKVELNNGEVLDVHQKDYFLYASLVLIVGSVIWFLFLLGIIKTMIGYAVMGVMAIGSFVLLFYNYKVVDDDVRFKKMYTERETEIQVRILDIKAAELAYKEVNDMFTNDMEALIDFVKNGKKMDYIKNGTIPERTITPEERDMIYGDDRPIDFLMNEQEAAFLARMNGGVLDGNDFQRDTVFVPVMEAIFNSERYLKAREKLGGDLDFHPDSMMYVPFSRNLTVIDTASVLKGELTVPTLLIKMTHPMEHPIDGFVEYSVGSLTDNHLRESWDK